MFKPTRLSIVLAFLLTASTPIFGAAQKLFVVEDPQTGTSAAAWSNQPAGTSTAEILYSCLNGSSWSPSVTLSTIARPGLTPALAFDGAGGRRVVFSTAETNDRVLMRSLASSDASWGPVIQMSDPSEKSSRPWVIVHGNRTYVSYEVVSTGGIRTIKVAKMDPDGHVERTFVASTPSTVPLEARIYSDSGHVWLDWIASNNSVGYSELVDGAWSGAAYASYEAGSSPDDGRARVRSLILGF